MQIDDERVWGQQRRAGARLPASADSSTFDPGCNVVLVSLIWSDLIVRGVEWVLLRCGSLSARTGASL